MSIGTMFATDRSKQLW